MKNTEEETISQKEKYHNFKGTIVKVTTDKKEFLDEFLAYLKLSFDCEPKSPKMYSEDLDKFFQYIAIQKREA